MDLDLSSGLGKTLLAMGSGLVGYAVREWRNRVEPLVTITQFRGGLRRPAKQIPIEIGTTRSLDQSALLGRLPPLTTLGDIGEIVNAANAVCERAPSVIERLNAVLAAIASNRDDSELCELLAQLFEPEYMDGYLANLLMRDRIRPPRKADNAIAKFEVQLSEAYEGSFVVCFPGHPVTIGGGFSREPIYRAKFQTLVDVLQCLDRPAIAAVLETIKTSLSAEVALAREVREPLERLLDADSRWETMIYFANLKATPVLVEAAAKLFVADKTGAKYSEDCGMVLVVEDPSGNTDRQETALPLIVPPGDSRTFGFVTKRTQQEMEFGQAFRETFSKGRGLGWVEIVVRSVGLVKRRRIIVGKEAFRAAD